MSEADKIIIDVDSLKLEELKEELRKVDLKNSGSKAVLQEYLRATLRQTKVNSRNADDEDDDNKDDDEDGIERE